MFSSIPVNSINCPVPALASQENALNRQAVSRFFQDWQGVSQLMTWQSTTHLIDAKDNFNLRGIHLYRVVKKEQTIENMYKGH